jgi:hypothetical protein
MWILAGAGVGSVAVAISIVTVAALIVETPDNIARVLYTLFLS